MKQSELRFSIFYQKGNKLSKEFCIIHFVFLFIFSGCSNKVSFEPKNIEKNNFPLIEQDGANISYSDSGIIRLVIHTGHLKDYSDLKEFPRQEFSKNLRVQILKENGEESGFLKAVNAVNDIEQELWTLTGDVVVSKKGGNSLYTDKLFWDREKKIFHTDSRVKIIQDGEEIVGLGLEAEEDLSKYTIFEVKGHLSNKKDLK